MNTPEKTEAVSSADAVRIAELERKLADRNRRLIELEKKYSRLSRDHAITEKLYADADLTLNVMLNSTCWKITRPLRSIGDRLKKLKSRRAGTAGAEPVPSEAAGPSVYFTRFAKRGLFTDDELERQRGDVFPRGITFSILVPVYNTPEDFLRRMIESVQAQTYSAWELCIADGSDGAHGYVGKICTEYARRDRRIKYRVLEKNLGISGNTNECIKMSTGEYIAIFDHDDLLHPAALHEVMKAVCEGDADFIYTDEATFSDSPQEAYLFNFKPDYAPDTLRAVNYICHFSVFSRALLDRVGGFRSEYDGSQDHDFFLRATDAARCVAHIPQALYFWRSHSASVASGADAKDYAADAGRRAVADFIRSRGMNASVTSAEVNSTTYRISYELACHPRVSIIIPNCEHKDALEKCVDSIIDRTTYDNYEIVIVENNSRSPELFDCYTRLQCTNDNIRVVTWQGQFNYPAINNFGVGQSTGEVLLLLNNDTEVITPEWIEEMLMYAQRDDVGAVGAKLYYPDGTVQHAGVLLGCGGVAAHYCLHISAESQGYMGRLCYAQNLTAVTAACLMVRREVWDEVGGMDEAYAVAFNDVDFCMKLRTRGYLNVWTPFAELHHYESLSRGAEDTPEKQSRFARETELFQSRWRAELAAGDPYYNPNFLTDRCDFAIKAAPEHYGAHYTVKDGGGI